MLRFLLGPRWLALHAALVAVLVAFVALGRWQLGSFEHHDRSHANDPTVPLERLLTPSGRVETVDVARRVTTAGTYDAARTLFVPGREHDGRSGFLVVTPMNTEAGVLPVLRGWVPRRTSPAAEPPAGRVALTGRIQPSESQSDSAVDPFAALPRGQVAYVGTVSLLAAWPYPPRSLFDGYVVAASERPAPAAVPARVPAHEASGGVSRWRNLAYALQWWLFAGAAVFFWASIVRRGVTERRRARAR